VCTLNYKQLYFEFSLVNTIYGAQNLMQFIDKKDQYYNLNNRWMTLLKAHFSLVGLLDVKSATCVYILVEAKVIG